MNIAILRGEVGTNATFSHSSHGLKYYQIKFNTMRLSGVYDQLKVLLPEETLKNYQPCEGDFVEIQGQIRSFNNKSGEGSRLVISVLAGKIFPCVGDPCNNIEIQGALCKPPMYRKTPMGREICDLMVAVARPYGRADYLPVIAWGASARVCAELAVGSLLHIDGRFQSRSYVKLIDGEPVEKTAYEISAVQITPHEEEKTENPDDMTENVYFSE